MLVFNMGAHYIAPKPGAAPLQGTALRHRSTLMTQRFSSDLGQWSTHVQTTFPGRIIWRDVSPSHFATDTGEYGDGGLSYTRCDGDGVVYQCRNPQCGLQHTCPTNSGLFHCACPTPAALLLSASTQCVPLPPPSEISDGQTSRMNRVASKLLARGSRVEQLPIFNAGIDRWDVHPGSREWFPSLKLEHRHDCRHWEYAPSDMLTLWNIMLTDVLLNDAPPKRRR